MFRVAVIGAGPAGCSATGRLLKSAAIKRVNLFDRSLVPFGLLRTGVAPDHPEVKHTAQTWGHIGQKCHFYGGVQIGPVTPGFGGAKVNLELDKVIEQHDAVLLANGAYAARRLNIPGSSSSRVLSAAQVVGDYNSDPFFSPIKGPLGGKVGLVGGGNVALDVARILLAHESEGIIQSDISTPFLRDLEPTTECHFFIRRSPFDLPCTTRELRELLTIPGVRLKLAGLDGQRLADIEKYRKLQKSRKLEDRKLKRLLKLLAEKEDSSSEIADGTKLIKFHFHHTPTQIEDTQNGIRLGLRGPCGEKSVKLDHLVESLGYELTPCGEISQIDVATGRGQFNEKTVYLAGWALSGAKGVVGDSTDSARRAVDRNQGGYF